MSHKLIGLVFVIGLTMVSTMYIVKHDVQVSIEACFQECLNYEIKDGEYKDFLPQNKTMLNAVGCDCAITCLREVVYNIPRTGKGIQKSHE